MKFPAVMTVALGLAACNSSAKPPHSGEDVAGGNTASGTAAPAADGVQASPAGDPGAPGLGESGAPAAQPAGKADSFVYVGGWDWSGAVYPYHVYALDHATGALVQRGGSLDFGANPSFGALTDSGRFLYIANEFGDGKGGIHVATLDAVSGAPTLLHREPYAGKGHVYASLSPDEKFVLATSYDDGKLLVYPVLPDGKVGPVVDTEEFGSSAQTHSVEVHPNGKWAYAPNKGLNNIGQLKFDPATGKLSDRKLLPTKQKGPRHIAITPDGKFAYVTMELDNRLVAYEIKQDGKLKQIDDQPLLPATFNGANTAAHVRVHPSGKFVYATNRGHDSVAVYGIGEGGKLTLIEHVETQGTTPRHFDISKDGKLLVLANQGDDKKKDGSLVVYAIGADGKLTSKGVMVSGLPSPTTVTIVTPQK